MVGQINRGNEYKVTIITSVFDASSFINGLLENVVSQTAFARCEWVIVDVNQPAGLESELVSKYMKNHSNIYYEILHPDPGIYSIWNDVIECADSDYITNWNCDDRRYPDSIAKQIEFLDNNPQIDLVYNDHIQHKTPNWVPCFSEPLSTISTKRLRGGKPRPDYSLSALRSVNLPHCDPVWRRSLHKKFGYFREDTRTVADYELWMRCALGGSTFKKLNDVMGIYYVNPQGLSTSRNRSKSRIVRAEMKSVITPLRNQIAKRLASE